jgi:anti-sigma regulatory factor (Ser/Thr protein kinase)
MRTLDDIFSVSFDLHADPRNVREARAALRGALLRSDAEQLVDTATLVLSELVTNAFVHAATDVRVNVWSSRHAVRVEVEDGGAHLPKARHYAETAGTGRGLHLLAGLVDRWGVLARMTGKTVWFEIGHFDPPLHDGPTGHLSTEVAPAGPVPERSAVTLRRVPLLMHVAWQEHAATLLRDYLLHVLDQDDTILERHARASEAMGLLHAQLPCPALSEEPDALMADAVEPNVTAEDVVLRMSPADMAHAVSRLARAATVPRR